MDATIRMRAWRSGWRNIRFLVESQHDFDAVHWDHEPTPNPSQEGNWHSANEHLLPSWERSGVGWFMVSTKSPARALTDKFSFPFWRNL